MEHAEPEIHERALGEYVRAVAAAVDVPHESTPGRNQRHGHRLPRPAAAKARPARSRRHAGVERKAGWSLAVGNRSHLGPEAPTGPATTALRGSLAERFRNSGNASSRVALPVKTTVWLRGRGPIAEGGPAGPSVWSRQGLDPKEPVREIRIHEPVTRLARAKHESISARSFGDSA
ncbi:hypothetical protein [Amycolatopsis sp. NPDC021455]|uniref:hypothetical protein n=1 Tax=Amycolatopsis sp. NPDC021455 TaxID=3154901 RepID=UPI0033D7E05F